MTYTTNLDNNLNFSLIKNREKGKMTRFQTRFIIHKYTTTGVINIVSISPFLKRKMPLSNVFQMAQRQNCYIYAVRIRIVACCKTFI